MLGALCHRGGLGISTCHMSAEGMATEPFSDDTSEPFSDDMSEPFSDDTFVPDPRP